MPVKYETPEILAPSKRLGKPCFDLSCKLEEYCTRKSIIFVEEGLRRELHVVPYHCDKLKCRNRIGLEKVVKITVCKRNHCKNLDLKNLQCRIRPVLSRSKSGRIAFGMSKGTTLRMNRGSDKGYHYRKFG